MNVQLIIVILIAIVVAAIVAKKVYRLFFVKDDTPPYCRGCAGCSLSNDDKRKANCK